MPNRLSRRPPNLWNPCCDIKTDASGDFSFDISGGKAQDTWTRKTQFIIITHRRKTMEIADRLYGVTMEEPGVSKLISIQLH